MRASVCCVCLPACLPVSLCVCAYACVRACVRASVRACVHATVRPCNRASVRVCVLGNDDLERSSRERQSDGVRVPVRLAHTVQQEKNKKNIHVSRMKTNDVYRVTFVTAFCQPPEEGTRSSPGAPTQNLRATRGVPPQSRLCAGHRRCSPGQRRQTRSPHRRRPPSKDPLRCLRLPDRPRVAQRYSATTARFLPRRARPCRRPRPRLRFYRPRPASRPEQILPPAGTRCPLAARTGSTRRPHALPSACPVERPAPRTAACPFRPVWTRPGRYTRSGSRRPGPAILEALAETHEGASRRPHQNQKTPSLDRHSAAVTCPCDRIDERSRAGGRPVLSASPGRAPPGHPVAALQAAVALGVVHAGGACVAAADSVSTADQPFVAPSLARGSGGRGVGRDALAPFKPWLVSVSADLLHRSSGSDRALTLSVARQRCKARIFGLRVALVANAPGPIAQMVSGADGPDAQSELSSQFDPRGLPSAQTVSVAKGVRAAPKTLRAGACTERDAQSLDKHGSSSSWSRFWHPCTRCLPALPTSRLPDKPAFSAWTRPSANRRAQPPRPPALPQSRAPHRQTFARQYDCCGCVVSVEGGAKCPSAFLTATAAAAAAAAEFFGRHRSFGRHRRPFPGHRGALPRSPSEPFAAPFLLAIAVAASSSCSLTLASSFPASGQPDQMPRSESKSHLFISPRRSRPRLPCSCVLGRGLVHDLLVGLGSRLGHIYQPPRRPRILSASATCPRSHHRGQGHTWTLQDFSPTRR